MFFDVASLMKMSSAPRIYRMWMNVIYLPHLLSHQGSKSECLLVKATYHMSAVTLDTRNIGLAGHVRGISPAEE